MSELIYLSCPFSADTFLKEIARMRVATSVASKMMAQGKKTVYSPITPSLLYQEINDEIENTWEFWRDVDFAYIDNSKKLLVLMLEGWRESRGVQAEVDYAEEQGIPIEVVYPADYNEPRDPQPRGHDIMMRMWLEGMNEDFNH